MMHHRKQNQEEGSLLVAVPGALLLAVGLVVATLTLSTANMTDANRETRKIQAYYAAKAGIEQQILDLRQMTRTAVLVDPFRAVEDFHDKKTYRDSVKLMPFPAPPNQQALLDPTGNTIDVRAQMIASGVPVEGTFEVSLHIEGFDPLNPNALSSSRRFVSIRSTGWVPNRNDPRAARHTLETTVLLELSASEVFDYGYFINNWGWFYGNTITANGNVRSNGQFDAGAYTPTIAGSPRYLGANNLDLYGYLDDNDDGVRDGTDGGIYAGWDIVAPAVQGMAATTDPSTGEKINQHQFDGQVEMPNLTNLAAYEYHATATGSSISIGGSIVCDSVYGDSGGESGHLVLIGTAASPIELNGTVVVRGSLIIKGVVTGQGVIYSGGNVYVADDVTYLNPPTTPRPAGPSEAETEAWLQANQSKDALGLFAREHVVLGDHTNPQFQYYVSSWMNNPANVSAEDAGEDGIPNTQFGMDGIPYTADDDFLESDGVWTVETYTAVHEALGMIPAGSNIGDAIPGTGEDIDGDGQYDGPFQMSQLTLPVALDSGLWGGNLPPGTTAMSNIASTNIARFDAAMYTNHTMAGLLFAWGTNIQFNGCIVSRNEAIVYGANQLIINHDARLLGGGDNFGYYLPRSFKSIRVMRVNDDVGNQHWDEAAAHP